MPEMAKILGVSYQYCYRQRAEICKRIAQYIDEAASSPANRITLDVDDFELRIDLVARAARTNDRDAAYRSCEDLLQRAQTLTEKLRALRVYVQAALAAGDPKANGLYTAASRIATEPAAEASPNDRSTASAVLDLIATTLAASRGDHRRALGLSKRAMHRIQRAGEPVARWVQEAYVEALYELGLGQLAVGNIQLGYEVISAVEAKAGECRSLALRSRVRATTWRLRNHLLTSAQAWYPSWTRLQGLTEAFQVAYYSGWHAEAATAGATIVEHHALAGNDFEALKSAKLALQLAKTSLNATQQARIQLEVCGALSLGGHWRQIDSLIPDRRDVAGLPDSYRRLAVDLEIEGAFRRGDYTRAGSLIETSAEDGYSPSDVQRHIQIAALEFALGRRSNSKRSLEAALSEAERLAIAPVLRYAYRVAARLTGESRFRRKAKELNRLMQASTAD